MITRYPSIAALARHCDANGITNKMCANRPAWYNHETRAQSLAYAMSGNDALVPEAEKLMDQFAVDIALPVRTMVADCAGAYPIVPDYLMGMPDCMRRRAATDDDAAPIQIYVSVGSHATITAEQLRRRGCAILALTMALARVRPVDLSIIHYLEHTNASETENVIVAAIETRPLDLATACYVLTSSGFSRRLMLGANIAGGGDPGGTWPLAMDRSDPAPYLAGLLARVGGDPATDLIMPVAQPDSLVVADPVAWVNQQLDRFREVI